MRRRLAVLAVAAAAAASLVGCAPTPQCQIASDGDECPVGSLVTIVDGDDTYASFVVESVTRNGDTVTVSVDVREPFTEDTDGNIWGIWVRPDVTIPPPAQLSSLLERGRTDLVFDLSQAISDRFTIEVFDGPVDGDIIVPESE